MKAPNGNPFEIAIDQIITSVELTRGGIAGLVSEFCGDDANIIAITKDSINSVMVRVSGWNSLEQTYGNFWLWITTDMVDFRLCFDQHLFCAMA